MADIKIEGLEKVVANFNKVLGQIKYVNKQAMKDAADDLLMKAKNQAPIETGTLRRSGFVREIKDGFEIGFGGEASAYAIVQHERLDFNHPHGGKAKYLEDPFKENWKAYVSYIAKKSGKIL